MDLGKKAFVIDVAHLKAKMLIHANQEAQIVLLEAKKVTIPAIYLDFTNLFSKKLAAELLERSDINKHSIIIEPGKQPPYGPIYNLDLVKLGILKAYIKTNLANNFIWPSKLPTRAPILFVWNPDNNLRLSVDYWRLNYLTIKNWYLLLVIDELFNWLSQIKQFT